MLVSLVLSMGLVSWSATALGVSNDKIEAATLIVVASTSGDPGMHEFLVIRAAGETISWSFIFGKGFTERGIDPEGKIEQKGTMAGTCKLLEGGFRATLGEITDTAQPKRGKTLRVPATFSLILIDSAGVRTCALLSGKQQRRLIHGDELKAVFSEVRKKVVGLGYLMPDLLQVGMNPDLGEPRVPVQFGPEWQLPKLPSGRQGRADGGR